MKHSFSQVGSIGWAVNVAKKMQARARIHKNAAKATGQLAAAIKSERGYIVATFDNPAGNDRKFILAAHADATTGMLSLVPVR